MKMQVTTKITTLIDIDTFETSHAAEVEAEPGVPESIARAAAVGACRATLQTLGHAEERPAVDAQLIERGTGAALSTLTDHETGAGSDLAPGDIDLDDDTYIEIHGRIDIRQLVREILEATR